jgi:putative transposase
MGEHHDTNTPNPTEKKLLDKLLKDYKEPEDILGEQDLLKRLSKAILERALGAELTDHLGYEKRDPAGYGAGCGGNRFRSATRNP